MQKLPCLIWTGEFLILTFLFIAYAWSRGNRRCGGDKGLSGRPLDPFGAVTPMLLGFYRKFSEP